MDKVYRTLLLSDSQLKALGALSASFGYLENAVGQLIEVMFWSDSDRFRHQHLIVEYLPFSFRRKIEFVDAVGRELDFSGFELDYLLNHEGAPSFEDLTKEFCKDALRVNDQRNDWIHAHYELMKEKDEWVVKRTKKPDFRWISEAKSKVFGSMKKDVNVKELEELVKKTMSLVPKCWELDSIVASLHGSAKK